MDFDRSQEEAIRLACGPGHRLVTGGAGTGKTTIIREIAGRLGAVDLLAPTGKAAARLRQVTGLPAVTVHSWLRWDGSKVNRTAPATRPVLIDESSMLDSRLLSWVLATGPRKLVLVGDGAQLPPVGGGQPFHDLLRLRPELVSTLETCHRAQAAVHRAANLIRRGEMPARWERSDGESWRMVDTGGPTRTLAQLEAWVKGGHFDPEQDIILACRNEQDHGIRAINERLVEILNPRLNGEKWKVGDRVIGTKNVNEEDWYNGDTGTVTAVDADGGIWVELDRPRDDGQILLDLEMQRECQLAYALTVHKSQGSQFRRVFVLTFDEDAHMLTRNLVYTGVTRAREGVVVAGQLRAFARALRQVAEKTTSLQLRAA